MSVDIRGQSETLGTVLLIGITVLGTTAIVIYGGTALRETEQSINVQLTEHTMSLFDAKASLVALGQSSTQQITIVPSTREGTVRTVDSGWLRVRIINYTTGAVEDTVINQSLGAIVYQNGDTEVAYQGGGVWKKTNNQSTMVSPPEFHYREGTLTLPIIQVQGSDSLKGTVTITQSNATDVVYPNASKGLVNPVKSGKVLITVQSDYYLAWGNYVESRTDSKVEYNHARDRVTVTLAGKIMENTVQGAIVSGASGKKLTIQNKGSVDSYNSSKGDYESTRSKNTSIVTAGDVEIQNQATIKGSLVAGGKVTMKNKALITGNLSYGESLHRQGSAKVKGWINNNASVADLNPVDGLINKKRARFVNDSVNDNGAEADINDATNRLVSGQSSWELETGKYYLSQLSLDSGDNLTLDTSNGDIQIVVDGTMTIQGNANITVVGDGRVEFYLTQEMTIQNQGTMFVPGDDSTQMWVFMKSTKQATIQNNARFVGVIYGPGENGNPGVRIEIKNQADVFGGLVGYVKTVQNKMGVHFDEALTSVEVFDGDEYIATINYIHITVQTLNVTE